MKQIILFTFSLFFSFSAFAASVSDLDWLSGQWSGSSPVGVYESSFTKSSGQMILGTNKLTDPSGVVSFYEYIQIGIVDEKLTLTPFPFGKQGVSFTAREVSGFKIVFENIHHDFPRVITYELNAAKDLVESVAGEQNGQTVEMQFILQKLHE
jgi:hypothetical protein